MNDEKLILVTGGAGYIGSMTVKELLDSGYSVVVLDSLENGHKEAVDGRAILEVADLSDIKRVEEIFDKHNPLAIIDFAAYLSVGESMENPVKYMINNVENFIGLLDVMVRKNVRYIIKSSTASTYGNPLLESDFPLKEDYQDRFKPEHSSLLQGKWEGRDVIGDEFFDCLTEYYEKSIVNNFKSGFQISSSQSGMTVSRDDLRLNQNEVTKLKIPASVYGFTKLLDEIILKKYNESSSLIYAALRYFNVCGATIDGKMGEDKPNPTTLMTMAIYSVLGKTGPLKVFGNDYPTRDGTGLRDYIHPLDLATGHVKALEYITKENTSQIFNLGNGIGNTVMEVINAVENASGKKVEYTIEGRRAGDPAASYADPTKAKEYLNWEAKYNLDQMAESAWKWHSLHPNGYKKIQ